MSKELLSKAIVDISKEKPADFNKKIEEVVAAKLSKKIESIVKQKEKELFKKK